MAAGNTIKMEQTQKMMITPGLRQAIMILQFPTLDLNSYLGQQLQENPMLELEEESDQQDSGSLAVETGSGENENMFDPGWQDYFQDSSDLGFLEPEKETDQDNSDYENYVRQEFGLTEFLCDQLNLVINNTRQRLIGRYLIGNLDENGYLHVSVDEVAVSLKATREDVEETLKIIQNFDPPGIGARNLQECLLIQVNQLNIKDKLLENVILRHLPELAKGKLSSVAHQLCVSFEDIQDIARFIKTLDPKPGCNYSSGDCVKYVIPDLVIEKAGQNFTITVNDCINLKINSYYRSIWEKEADSKVRQFLGVKLNAAVWLIKSVEQRRNTLSKIANCLIALQQDFLKYGCEHLKPLNLKQVAKIVGLHESTVSRATSNKYVQTPQGMFPMRSFFSAGLNCGSDKETSAAAIKESLRKLVARENPVKPLNDQEVAGIFAERGIKISRRTIAKYRGEIGIPPARQRIRY
ncbi:MAG TPA: RNA polymerase sigma-54 factor [Desulfotomaculum sp.]|nr:MAG: RNA polymerase, sigma 54 subunit, RpoN [Desulfotomaculum sp. 46_80]KUK85013.1 MAG: RNA polymerase, sigma 54 subunit, RpoN [Desulfofundulus kuznetsovii]HAG10412.1 RNA polymerase sigma-54 factor [Desulfotomaculum sp.]HBY04001.1 RNA polymerase sigma-54 factor [Desulfotomaculum sp.]